LSRRVLVVGASGHAKVVVDAIRSTHEFEIVGIADRDAPVGVPVFGLPVLASDRDILRAVDDHAIDAVVIAIGDNWTRAELTKRIAAERPALGFATVVHRAAHVSSDSMLGEGTVVFAGAVVNPGARVSRYCIINTNASVDHDCTLGDGVSIAPGATLGGNVVIGECSSVGLGASVVHSVSIGRDSVVGAGAVVVDDIPDNVVAFGVPARVIRGRQPSD
jgi:sugar O-acyltransferase (sialic acid O-acetyltransferase NeuD family)